MRRFIQPRQSQVAVMFFTALLGLSGSLAFGSPPDASAKTGSTDHQMPLLMPDDFSDLHLTAWRVERGEPDANNPLIEGEMPWDLGGVGVHGCVLKDPIDGLFKAYLVCTPEDPAVMPNKAWGSDNAAYRLLCLFESKDGVHWTRPALSNVPKPGHAKNNILFDPKGGMTSYGSVFVNPKDREWPYDMIVLRESYMPSAHGAPPQGSGYYRYRSKDGRAWELVRKVDGPMTGDLAFFYRYGDDDYVCYYRLGAPRRPNDHVPIYEDTARRSLYRATSRDGNTWVKDPSTELTADERDHRDTQYQECVPIKVNGGYFALITMYHPITQTLNLRMAASRDGKQWWFPDRVPCLDNPPLGDYGGGMIWQSKNLIVQESKLYVYYGGTEGPHRQVADTRAPSVKIGPQETVIDHGAHFLPVNSALCRASWDADRLYALISSAGGPTLGTATTKPAELAGRSLWLNLRTRPAKKSTTEGLDEGQLQVELLDAAGKPLKGFTREDCSPVKGDHHAIQVKWAGGAQAPATAKSAKFYLKRAFLYGFEFRDAKDSAAESKKQASASKVELRPYQWQGPYTKMRAERACPHDAGLCADLRAPGMKPGERLILRAAEIVGYESGYFYDDHFPTQEQQGRGKGYRHTSFQWDTKKAPEELSAVCAVPGKGEFTLRLTAGADFVDIVLAIRNDTNQAMKYVDWYFCPVAYEAPSLFNPSLDRAFLYDGERMRSLASIAVRGTMNETMHVVGGARGSNGFIPPLHSTNPKGSVEAKSPLVIVENDARTFAVGLAFERAHSIFCSAGNGCFHADPYFGSDLRPGEQRQVRGRLYLLAGTATDVLKRFENDFPQPPAAG